MEIRKVKIAFIILLMLPFAGMAQLDCSSFFKYRKANPPFRYNSASKSAVCITGNKYEFILPLQKGFDYRLQFYASPVFNNNINFKIIDLNTNETVLDLPGETEFGEKGSCVLKAYFDEGTNKQVHPFFDFYPSQATSLQIIIDVQPLPKEETSGYNAPAPREKGCITVLVLDKPAMDTGFSN